MNLSHYVASKETLLISFQQVNSLYTGTGKLEKTLQIVLWVLMSSQRIRCQRTAGRLKSHHRLAKYGIPECIFKSPRVMLLLSWPKVEPVN